MKYRGKTIVAIAALLIAFASSAMAAQTISVNFQGRKSDSSGPTPALVATDVAGVVAVGNWNNVNDSVTTPKAEIGVTGPLNDSTGAATPVTLSFAANDSWNNDVNPTNLTGNAKMMNGVIKEQHTNTTATFTFTGVPEGQYDVYVYMDSNNDNVALNVADGNNLQTYYVIAQHQFAQGAAFVQSTNTNPTGTRDVGNYVKLSNVATFGLGSVGVNATYISGGDGLGIAGIQIVNTGASPVNTNKVVLTSQPASQNFPVGTQLTFSVTKTGPATFQWFKNGTAIPGATNGTYITPPLTAADDKSAYHVVASNAVNTVISADAIATLHQLNAIGFAKDEFWAGQTLAGIEDPAFATPPDKVSYRAYFEVPVNQADNFGERVTAIFTPAVSGNYVFFVCSDDQSDLFLSTDDTPANKKLIAQETLWSNSRQWLTSAGASDVTSKRSDQFTGTQWPTANTITLVAGKRYYIEGDHFEGGGGDDFAATFILEGQPDPIDGSAPALTGPLIQTIAQDLGINIAIGTQPANVSVQELTTTTLSVAATGTETDGGTPPIFYQWQKLVSGTNYANIPGATSPTFTTPLLNLPDTGGTYRVVLTSIGVAVTSASAVVTVLPDTTPPRVLAVGSIKNANNNNTEITVVFDEPLKDAANATTLANYTLNSGAVTAARYVTNSSGVATRQSGVVLTATGITPGTNYTLTVKGVSDTKGNTSTGTNVTFTASSFNWISIGTVAEFVPATFVTATNSFNLVSGGNAFWTIEDDITMVYQEITGDFDKIAQVEYTDPASNWARSGISARDTLNNGTTTTTVGGANPAGRYQMVISDPAVKFDGTAGNNTYEVNRRLNTGGGSVGDANATSGAYGPNVVSGTPLYPNSWVRLKRVGQIISYYYSSNSFHWVPLGNTDFGDTTISDAPLPAKLFVGPTYGPENNNISADVTSPLRGLWSTRIRNYGDAQPVQKPHGSETYAIGLNFGANESGALLSSNEVAGVDAVAQANWNNIIGIATPDTGAVGGIVADKGGVGVATTVTVDWTSPNTWESTGRGEENNTLTGADHTLMTGYLDTAGAGTTPVKISNIPSDLTSGGYDVYIYALGSVAGRGGGYEILDAAGSTVLAGVVLAQDGVNPTNYVAVPQIAGNTNYGVGDYIVFKGLKAATINVQSSTDNGLGFSGTPRAPINAIQLVAASSAAPTLSITRTGAAITITYTGKLQAADLVTGPYTDVTAATSPFPVVIGASKAKFYRATQ